MTVIALLIACARPADGDADAVDTADTAAGLSGPSGAAYAEPACAPDDGLAVRIVVGIEGEGCDAALAAEHVRISLWQEAPLAPGVYELGSETGSAWYAADGAAEVYGPAGTVTVAAWDAERTGSYAISLEGGGEIGGDFTAAWCDTDPRCG